MKVDARRKVLEAEITELLRCAEQAYRHASRVSGGLLQLREGNAHWQAEAAGARRPARRVQSRTKNPECCHVREHFYFKHGDRMITRRTILKASLGLASSVAFAPFRARSAEETSPNLALAGYTESDRAVRILAAAKKEGQVNFYTTIAKSDLEPLLRPFEKKYGIKVNAWRAGDEQVVQRAVSEARAGRYIPDNVHVGSSFLDSL
jgi:hypothetical protein